MLTNRHAPMLPNTGRINSSSYKRCCRVSVAQVQATAPRSPQKLKSRSFGDSRRGRRAQLQRGRQYCSASWREHPAVDHFRAWGRRRSEREKEFSERGFSAPRAYPSLKTTVEEACRTIDPLPAEALMVSFPFRAHVTGLAAISRVCEHFSC
jgi:hypothetical protein